MRWACLLFLGVFGCSDGRVKDWRPEPVAGPLEVRQLPLSEEIVADYTEWLGSGVKARVYETRLHENIFTNHFRYEQRRHETPLGRPMYTTCEFRSSDPRYRGYQFEFSLRGKHSTNNFDFAFGKTLWVQPIGTNSANDRFRLHIVAIEGTPAFTVIVAGDR